MTKPRLPKVPEPLAPPVPESVVTPLVSPAIDLFPVVGIGASAGGLAAFEEFFSGMPADVGTGMAFVLVQHLSPDHKSILTNLVQRYTRMQVSEVVDGVTLRRDCAYIIPPNCDMALLAGRLHLLEPSAPRGQRLPIDFFFRSLAQELRERAIGVVLSGTGSDGTLGARAIKGEGGLVIAQIPGSTEFDGMPSSVIRAGLVDYELVPAEMPGKIMAYVGHAFGKLERAGFSIAGRSDDVMNKIFVLLRAQTGHDFSQYKPNTVLRRIERRMAVHQVDSLSMYLKFLQGFPNEAILLFRDLLIGVTRFFRDREAFVGLEDTVIPKLLAEKPAGSVVRVWVPGCSTGEEAYSIAMLIQERILALRLGIKLQVFASDIDTQAIAVARTGVYPASVAPDISKERLGRFFTSVDGTASYRVNKDIRDLVVFSEQDLVRDPPFSKLDVISCRNLLIYLSGELQRKVLSIFHYALNPGGVLFLGTSETVGEFGDQFVALDRRLKIYQKRGDKIGTFVQPASVLVRSIARRPIQDGLGIRKAFNPGKTSLRDIAEQALLKQVAPAAALVNAQGVIQYLHGRTGQYLEPAEGEAGENNILKMARSGLRRELTTALHKAAMTSDVVCRRGLRVKTNGDYTLVDLSVQRVVPESDDLQEIPRFLVILRAAEDAGAEINAESPRSAFLDGEGAVSDTNSSDDPRVSALLKELHAKEEYLQSANEELETSNQELMASSEEMQSVNEELQATNEELETAKEEMQSINEELSTVNSELQSKVQDLSRINNDMNNLLAGTGIGTVFVDFQQRIMRFTPAAAAIINLIHGDVGRPVGHIVSNLMGYDRLEEDTQIVLNTLIPREVEVRSKKGLWYSMRILPYRTSDNVIEGAVISFLDITELRIARDSLLELSALRRFASVLQEASDAIILHSMDGRILAWNHAATSMYGWKEVEALELNISELIPEEGRDKELATVHKLGLALTMEPYRTRRNTRDRGTIDISLTAIAISDNSSVVYAVATIEKCV
jgi:two-component system CheB/CheR fusion protein